jgi:transposase
LRRCAVFRFRRVIPGRILRILEADQIAPLKQRHTAKRIFERLRDEHGFAGGYTAVKDHVRICRARGRETFVPLSHPPGQAQVDFGEAVAIIGGVRQKINFFCMDLPKSDACFVKGYSPALQAGCPAPVRQATPV